MLVEALLGFLFMVGWALSYALVLRQRSMAKAVFGVFPALRSDARLQLAPV